MGVFSSPSSLASSYVRGMAVPKVWNGGTADVLARMAEESNNCVAQGKREAPFATRANLHAACTDAVGDKFAGLLTVAQRNTASQEAAILSSGGGNKTIFIAAICAVALIALFISIS